MSLALKPIACKTYHQTHINICSRLHVDREKNDVGYYGQDNPHDECTTGLESSDIIILKPFAFIHPLIGLLQLRHSSASHPSGRLPFTRSRIAEIFPNRYLSSSSNCVKLINSAMVNFPSFLYFSNNDFIVRLLVFRRSSWTWR